MKGIATKNHVGLCIDRPGMKKFALIICFSMIFMGCDQFTWFQSEGSVRKKLKGTWERVFPDIVDYDENWVFNDGTLTILQQTPPNPVDTVDEGTYEVNTGIFSAHVKLEGFAADSVVIQYNQNWTIIDLDDRILYMVADIQAGLIQREFVKKD